MKTFSITEAQANLARIIKELEENPDDPIIITRQSYPVAQIIYYSFDEVKTGPGIAKKNTLFSGDIYSLDNKLYNHGGKL